MNIDEDKYSAAPEILIMFLTITIVTFAFYFTPLKVDGFCVESDKYNNDTSISLPGEYRVHCKGDVKYFCPIIPYSRNVSSGGCR